MALLYSPWGKGTALSTVHMKDMLVCSWDCFGSAPFGYGGPSVSMQNSDSGEFVA